MNYMKAVILGCAISLVSSVMAEDVQETAIIVGGRTIKVPAPPGFVRCDGVSEQWDRLMGDFLPPTNRFLAYFGKDEDLALLRKGEFPTVEHSLNIQVVRQVESMEFGQATFADAKDDLKSGLESMRSKISSEVE